MPTKRVRVPTPAYPSEVWITKESRPVRPHRSYSKDAGRRREPHTPSTTASGSQELSPPVNTFVTRANVRPREVKRAQTFSRVAHVRPEDDGRLTHRNRLGKGRDAIVYEVRLGRNGWGVLKVPRHIIPDIPVPYLEYLVYKHTDIDTATALTWMNYNFNHECSTLTAVWNIVARQWLPLVGFPANSLLPDPSAVPELVTIVDSIQEDSVDKPVHINATIDTRRGFLLPRAVCDAFNALLSHFSVHLFRAFLEDILFQMRIMEEMRIVHGDLKLANILLVRMNDSYVFLLSDFWDGFPTDKDGRIEFMQPNNVLRRLFSWKFSSEKFGTRLYKDPCLLDRLRSSRGRFERVVLPQVGAPNMWSLGIIILVKLLPRDRVNEVKDKLKTDILVSNPPRAAEVVVKEIEELALPYIKGGKKSKTSLISTLGLNKYLRHNQNPPSWLEKLHSLLFTGILTMDTNRLTAAEVRCKQICHAALGRAGSQHSWSSFLPQRFLPVPA